MARVAVVELKQIVDTAQDATKLEAMIATANSIVSANLTDAGLSAATLKTIEMWMAAHLLSVTVERQAIRVEIGGDTNEQYAKLGLGLESTTYGQTVKILDTTGILANLGKRLAKIEAVTSFEV